MSKNTAVAAAPKRKKIASLDRKKARAGWLFVLPFILGFIIVYIPIIIDSIQFSFSNIVMLDGGGFRLDYVGLDNYTTALFENAKFVQRLTAGVQEIIFDIPAIIIFSLFMAVLLNQKMVGRAAFRAIFFVPVILSTGLINDIDDGNDMLEYMGDVESGTDDGTGVDAATQIVSYADIGWLFQSMKVGTEIVTYITDLINNIYNIINRSGVQILIFLAGLQSISPAIYESCSIDGATTWETFWKITFPMVSPMILVNAVYTVVDAFTISTNTAMDYITKVYEGVGGQTSSAAMSWIYFLIVFLIIGVVAAIVSAFVFYQRRD